MGNGIDAVHFAIPRGKLDDFLAGKAGRFLLRQVTAADAGTAEISRVLPFSDTAEELAGYLKNFDLWFVTPSESSGTVLFWVHTEEFARLSKRRDLREGERGISISGAMRAQDPTAEEVAAIKATMESLQLLGARKL